MLSLVQLLEILQQTQLVSPTHLNTLRRLADASPKEFTTKVALRWLIEQKQLTLRQAERLVLQLDPELAASLNELQVDDDAPIPLDAPAAPALDLSRSPPIPVRTPWSQPTEPVGPASRPEVKPGAQPEPELRFADEPLSRETTAPVASQAAKAVPVAARAQSPSAVPPQDAPTTINLDALIPPSKDDLFGDIPATTNSALLSTAPTKRVAGTWDSPLMLVGGGALLLLVIVGLALAFLINRDSGDQILQQADEDYRQGAFAQAIHKFDRFLEQNPRHPRASYVRVQRGTARLRQAIDSTTDGAANLALAQEVLSQISGEANFGEARPELAALLPKLAEHLAKQAVEKSEEAELVAARESYTLATKPQYVPDALRPTAKLTEIEQLLRLAERRYGRGIELNNTIAAIAAATQSGDFAAGFEQQRKVLREYPDLRDHPQLISAMQSLSQGLRGAVRYEPLDTAPQTDELSGSVVRAVTPIRYATGLPAKHDQPLAKDAAIALLPIEGSAYAFEAATGRALWRRYLGGTGQARRIDASPRADALVIDAVTQELARLDVLTGRVRWRVPFAKPISAALTIHRNSAFVATQGGQLHQIALDTGRLTARWHLPQELLVPPLVDPAGALIYALADHTHLYVLSMKDKRCVEVATVGHGLGQIVAPPVVIGRYLFLAENRTSDAGLLRTMYANAEGVQLRPLETLPYRGQVQTPLASQGRTLALVNQNGAVSVFEVATSEQGSAPKKLFEHAGDTQPPLLRYLSLDGGGLTLTGYEVSVNDLQLARGRLTRRWASSAAGPIANLPVNAAGRQIFAQQSLGSSAWIVEGAEPQPGGARWQTWLVTQPVSLDRLGDDKSLRLVSSSGDIYLSANDDSTEQRVAHVTRSASGDATVLDALPLDDRRVLLWSRDGQLVWVDTSTDKREPLRKDVSAAPTIFGSMVLVPRSSGEIEALNRDDLQPACEPFQPGLQPGVEYRWTRPAISADGQSFVVSDLNTQLYRVGLKQSPKSHLAALQSVAVREPIEGLALGGETIYGRTRDGVMQAFTLSDLQAGNKWAWSITRDMGPWSVGNEVLVLHAPDTLRCLASDGSERWHVGWPHGVLAGSPVRDGPEAALLVTRGGEVLRVQLADGVIKRLANVGQPLASGALRLGDRLVVCSTDGTLLWLDPSRGDP